jgi:putative DNA primase/helicase
MDRNAEPAEVSTDPGPLTEDEAKRLTERIEQSCGLSLGHFNDISRHSQRRIAHRFAREHADEFIYAHGIGWHLWDGTRWKPDRDGATQRALDATIDTAFRAAIDMQKKEERDQLISDAQKSESAAGFNGTLAIARNLKPLAVDALTVNSDPYLLNTQDGTYDLRTQQIRPHEPTDLITKMTASGVGRVSDGPWHEFVAQVLPDAELRDYVQRLLGYALLGLVREHLLPIFYGRRGRNGKSVLLNTVMGALGDYANTVDNSLIIKQRFKQHRTFKAKLCGLRLAITKESADGARLDADEVKDLTGGDRLQANFMRQDEIEWYPTHTFVLHTNFKPSASADDDALWERIRVVTFEQRFVDGNAGTDKQLEERLKLCYPEVMRWLVDGYARYFRDGQLITPDRVRRDTQAMRDECDDLGRFLEECADNNVAAMTRSRDAFEAWSGWCHDQNIRPGMNKTFKKRMEERGYESSNRRLVGVMTKVYLGLRLNQLGDQYARPSG